jgi:uncharacterized alkaline shock family protein YloU
MTEIKTNGPGQVKIADDVVAVIAGTAALEAEGVAGLAGHLGNDIAERLGRKHLGKGVTVKIENNVATVAAEIAVKAGVKIQDVAREVQDKIKTAIETMTGLTVAEVNVSVSELAAEKPEPANKTRKA